MVQKVNGIVTITGEKLYEGQFIDAVNKAQTQSGKHLNYFTGYANLEDSCYDWYFEFEDANTTQAEAEAFGRLVDENIKQLNMEYQAKRDSFRLHQQKVYRLQLHAFDSFKQEIINQSGQDASRFKPNVLAQNEERHEVIKHYVLK